MAVEYWHAEQANARQPCPNRHGLEGLAHSILTAIDQGNLALVPAGLLEAHGLDEEDISGSLNDHLFGAGIWSDH